MKVALTEVARIPEEGAVTVDFFGREAFVLNLEGGPRAVMNVCMHLGGPLELRGDRFVCGWHQAEYDLGGRRRSGPANADSHLMFLPTRVEDGTLYYVYGPDGGE
ncbi:MAG TPA: Rieske 2Fe-2S domain-containing protein [Acidimicrobiales bacterium]|nr:Rieske 2Fe-2S domain-containing protein [Acidimicrobiales bacterium]